MSKLSRQGFGEKTLGFFLRGFNIHRTTVYNMYTGSLVSTRCRGHMHVHIYILLLTALPLSVCLSYVKIVPARFVGYVLLLVSILSLSLSPLSLSFLSVFSLSLSLPLSVCLTVCLSVDLSLYRAARRCAAATDSIELHRPVLYCPGEGIPYTHCGLGRALGFFPCLYV